MHVTKSPWYATAKPSPSAKIPSLEGRGLRCMMSFSGFSIPSANAGKQSVIRLIHKRCGALKIVKFNMVAIKMDNTSARLEASKN